MPAELTVHAPGRVNLIGDHTDYTGGLVFPMAIDRGTTIVGTERQGRIRLVSDQAEGTVEFELPFTGDPAGVRPRWGSYVASMARELGATAGIDGRVSSDIPVGAGLSSSHSLGCAVALALGFEGTPLELAEHAQRAEHAATGVPTGMMDQLCIAAATEGHATMIDCATFEVTQVPLAGDVEIVVVFVAHRTLEGSGYADRVAECERAESEIGPLRSATLDEAESIGDEIIRRRARHVVTETARVPEFADALASDDLHRAGALMVDSHRSLRDDYETSTAEMDAAVERIIGLDGVFGARMTGGGFGGCVVALAEPGALEEGWIVTPSAGARVISPRNR